MTDSDGLATRSREALNGLASIRLQGMLPALLRDATSSPLSVGRPFPNGRYGKSRSPVAALRPTLSGGTKGTPLDLRQRGGSACDTPCANTASSKESLIVGRRSG